MTTTAISIRCLAMLILLAANLSLAASFDCSRANNAVEKLICKDEYLSDLDEVVSENYNTGLHVLDKPGELRSAQREWLLSRNRCNTDRVCLAKAYEARLRDLSGYSVDNHYADGVVEMLCDGANETVQLRPSRVTESGNTVGSKEDRVGKKQKVSHSVVAGDEFQECVFTSGRSVRIKVGGTLLYALGHCGADPGFFVSVWIDKAKAISRWTIRAPCSESVVTKAVISKSGVKWCSLKTFTDERSVESPFECSFEPAKNLDRKRDFQEYPERKVVRPPLGSYVIEYTHEKTLCEQMVYAPEDDSENRYRHIGPPRDAAKVVREGNDAGHSEGSSGYYLRSNFDGNNDGKPDLVISMHVETRPHDADTYFIQRDDAVESIWPNVDRQAVAANSSLIVPYSWSSCGASYPDDSVRSNCLVALKNFDVRYRARYVHITPFLWNGKTYFLGRSLEESVNAVEVVWRPLASGGVDEICIFRRIDNNY